MNMQEWVAAYNALRQPGHDHGIMGAYYTLREQSEELPPPLEEILEARCVRHWSYQNSLDHGFSTEEHTQYDSLKARGRTAYDNFRWYGGLTHSDAFHRARDAYGLKRR